MKYVIDTQFCLCLIYRNIGPKSRIIDRFRYEH